MLKVLASAAAAGLLALSFHGAHAAPIAGAPAGASAPDSGIVLVHGFHRQCRWGPGGWHRHDSRGRRRLCRTWSGSGPRPPACIRIGSVWVCQ